MKAIIMAAGASTRTHPLTVNIPKPLLPVMNKPIIMHSLDALKAIESIDEVIIIVGFKKEMIMERLGDEYEGMKITYVVQEKPEGTAQAVMLAKEHITDNDSDSHPRFVIMNGDDLFFGIEECAKQICVQGKHVENLSSYGALIKEGEHLREIIEKPNMKEGLANTGLYVFESDFFDCLQVDKSPRGEFELPDAINEYCKKRSIAVVETDRWLPIGYPWDILNAHEGLMNNIKGNISADALIEERTTLKGEVIVGRGTIIKNGAYIEGPVIIGEDCTIGPNCYIRSGSCIGKGCKVGNSVEIKNTILFDNVSVGHLTYMGDSIVGNGTNIGAGTITANLKHDNTRCRSMVKGRLVDTGRRKLGAVLGEDVHTGINTSIYPGRKMWPGSSTRPGIIVDKDIE
ncbi:NTP transferase domain-containing protein [Candidatus Woesearchaeota archaeon]|nr:NTP transferase domain-containing protein [Candidatus Woesearchaeota archaeon]